MKSKLIKNKFAISSILIFSFLVIIFLSFQTTNAVVYPPPEGPVADAGPDQEVYVGQEVVFDGSNSYHPYADLDYYIVSWSWNFGDESEGTGEIVTHTYNVAGEYIVTLEVEDNAGLTDIDTAEVIVMEIIPQSENSNEDNSFIGWPLVYSISVGLGALVILFLLKPE